MADGVRFEEAIDFLRRRLALPGDRWNEIVQEIDKAARDRSAGMSDALMRDVLAAVLDAIEDGGAFESFLDDYLEAIRRHGWTTGDELDLRQRAELTFRIATAQAYAAGRWAQIQRNKALRPWLRYVHVDPKLTQRYSRPHHAAWHGTILHADDSWWDVHYPPNGWNCRCYVTTHNDRDLARFGWTVSERPAEATEIRWTKGGAVETPKGVDPGFAYNVGKVGLSLPRG